MVSVSCIYEIFLSQIDDDLLAMYKPDIFRRQLHIYLLGAIVDFKACEKDLTVNDYSCFTEELKKGTTDYILPSEYKGDVEIYNTDYELLEEEVDYTIEDMGDGNKIVIFLKEITEKLLLFVVNDGYIEDLTLEEQYILALGMLIFWLRPKKNREENLKNIISDGSYKKLSSANILEKIIKLYDRTVREQELRIIDYTYNDFGGFN